MKTNIKHGIIFAQDSIIRLRGQDAILVNNESSLICSFLRNGLTNIVSIGNAADITWKLSNKRNKLFLEYDANGDIKPLTVRTDGTETIRSGKIIPKTAPEGSLFYDILQDCIFLRVGGNWVKKSVITVGEVLGMRVMSQPQGSRTATSYEIESGSSLFCRFGYPIINSSTLVEYDNIDEIEVTAASNYTIVPIATNLPIFSCVNFTNEKISTPSKTNLPNGVLIAKNKTSSFVAYNMQIYNISIALEDGAVFCTADGKLTSTPNNIFYCQIGEYDSKTKKLTIQIKDREYII